MVSRNWTRSVSGQRIGSLRLRVVACLLVCSQAMYGMPSEAMVSATATAPAMEARAPFMLPASWSDPLDLTAVAQGRPLPMLPLPDSAIEGADAGRLPQLLAFNSQERAGDDSAQSTGQGVVFTPAAVEFNNVVLGAASAAVKVTAHNYTTSPAKYSASTGLKEFKLTAATCPLQGSAKTLAPGATCTFEAAFAPTALGTSRGSITLTAGTAKYTLDLAGTGVAAKLDFFPASANFGDAGLKTTSEPIKVTASNFSKSPVKYQSSSGSNEFKIEGGTCPLPGNGKTLASGASCTFEVAFAPTASGAAHGEITWSDGTANATFSLSGTGVAAKLEFSPSDAAFGDVVTGATSPAKTVEIHNYTGSVVRYLSSTSLTEFKLSSTTCPLPGNGKTLEPDASCSFTAEFAPTKAGAAAGDIKFSDGKTTGTFALTGTGTSVAAHANAGGPYTGKIDTAVSFNGSHSTAPTGEKLTAFAWNFGDGATGTGAQPSHTYTKAGAFNVKLTVTDSSGGTGSATTTATIAAGQTAPTISGFSPTSGTVGTLIQVSGTNLSSPGISPPQISLKQQSAGLLPAPISAYTSSTLSFVIPPGASTGPVEVTVGTLSATSSGTLTVNPSSSYTLGVSPSTAKVIQGQSTALAVTLNSTNGFSGLANLGVTGLPSGVTANFSPATVAAGQVSTLTISAPANQSVSTSTITVTASATINGQSFSQTGTASVQVQAITTSFLGRTVVDDAAQEPLAGVTVSFVGQDGAGRTTGCSGSTISDAGGNFVLSNLPTSCTGPQLISYNGATATSPAGKYAGVNLTYTLTASQVTTSPVLVHLPRIDNAETVEVQQNAANDQVFYFSSIPGLKVTVYAGTTLSLDDGSQPNPFPLVALSIPLDRLPDKIPTHGMLMPFIVAFQPANAVASLPVAVNFPNSLGIGPGTSVTFVTLDPTRGVMVPYGTGTVSADGTEFVANADPNHPGHQYGLVHFDWHGPAVGPPPGVNPGPDKCGGSGGSPNPPACNVAGPVDVSSGIVSYDTTDLIIKGGRGSIAINRYYRTLDTNSGPFGLGTSMSYSYSLNTLSFIDGGATIALATPDGNQYTMSQAPDGTFVNAAIPALRGAVLTANGTSGPYVLRWLDGTQYTFTVNTALGFRGAFLTSITDLHGNVTTLTLNPTNPQQVQTITDPVGRSLTLTYDSSNRITKVTDPIGRSVQYTYNSSGTLATFTDTNAGVTGYTYDSSNNLATISDPRGTVTEQNTYNESFDGRVTQQVRADGGVYKFAYTLLNPGVTTSPVLQTIVTDPLGNQTIYRFNPQGFLISATDASGQTRTLTRDAAHNNLVTAYTGSGTCPVCGNPAAGNVSYTFDSLGNVLTSTDGDGNTTTYTYDPRFNKLTSVKDPLGNTVQFTYDASGDLISVTDANGHTTQIAFNSLGLPTQVTDPTGAISALSYDAFGNLSSSTNALGNATSFVYDAVSRLTQAIDPLGKKLMTSYDALDRVVSTTDPLGNTVQYTYDAIGSLLSMQDPKGSTISFTYNSMGRLSTLVNALGKTESYAYDVDANLIQFTDRRGQVSKFQYDVLNRPVAATYQDSTLTMSYDATGRLLNVLDSASGSFGFSYDAAGRLLTQSEPNGTVHYTHDAVGRTVSSQVVGLSQVSYTFDPAGNMTNASNAKAGMTYSYDGRNLPKSITRTNGVTSAFSFDPLGELLSIVHSKGASTLNALKYEYTADGTRSTVSNDISQALATQSAAAQVNAANQLLANAGTTYTYDDNGNRLTETTGSTVLTYTWDSRNRLTSIADNSGNKTVLQYDFGRNLIEIDKTSPQATSTQKFVIDSLTNVVSLTDANSLPVAVLTGQSLDSHLASVDSSGNVLFGLFDALGSNLAVTDSAGNVASQLYFEPYGQTSGTPAANFPFAFTGRIAILGNIYYNRARYYDASVGRFLSDDPIGLLGGTNEYLYGGDDPIDNSDPTGKFLVGAFVGGVFGALSGGLGAYAQGGGVAEIVEGAAIGGVLGGAVGLLDPTEGALTLDLAAGEAGWGTLAILGAAAGGLGDAAGQELGRLTAKCPEPFHWGEFVGATIGGGLGGGLSAGVGLWLDAAPLVADDLAPGFEFLASPAGKEWLVDIGSGLPGLIPSTLGGPIGYSYDKK